MATHAWVCVCVTLCIFACVCTNVVYITNSFVSCIRSALLPLPHCTGMSKKNWNDAVPMTHRFRFICWAPPPLPQHQCGGGSGPHWNRVFFILNLSYLSAPMQMEISADVCCINVVVVFRNYIRTIHTTHIPFRSVAVYLVWFVFDLIFVRITVRKTCQLT